MTAARLARSSVVRVGRAESAMPWYRRRDVLQAAVAFLAMGGVMAAMAQQRGNVVRSQGDILVNGQPLQPGQSIATGDRIQTGPGSELVFVVGDAAFHVRQTSHLVVERGSSLSLVALLRILDGAVASVWAQGKDRTLVTPTSVVGIRGTGLYAEVNGQDRGYFCNCYGTVDLATTGQSLQSTAEYHQSFWIEPAAVDGRMLTPAPAVNHTDEEIEFLAQLVGQPTAWQRTGRRGSRDGSGYGAYSYPR